MAPYTRDSVERVKAAVDMVELVSARTELRRVGSRHTGLCPFHEERTPSFSVDAEQGLYHCFGCGESGDAIGFVRASEGLEFAAALEELAERYGVELRREQEDPRAEERRRRRERLLEITDRATTFYSRFLWDSGEARPVREYLEGRGLGEEVLRAFRVGYAPSAWDRLLTAARRDGYTPEELVAAGVAQPGRSGRTHDRFRARIIFPLADARGRVLGFGARAQEGGRGPKYLNTSENELFHKGRQLFGIDRARASAARAGRIVAVEGYTDVLALHQYGIEEAVAVMGTALTQDQLAELSRAAGTVFLAFDADRSGQEAMQRAARAADDRGVELRVVEMPVGRDPAEVVTEEGAAAFRGRLAGALTVPEFAARRVLAGADLSTAGGRDRAVADIGPVVAMTREGTAVRAEVIRYVADRVDLSEADLLTQLRSAPARAAEARPEGRPDDDAPRSRPAAPAPATAARGAAQVATAPERSFLAMCLAQGQSGRRHLERLTDDHFSSAPVQAAGRWLAAHFENPLDELPEDDPGLAAQVRELVMLAGEQPSSQQGLELGFLQLDLRRLERELRRAARGGDFERHRELIAAREDARRQLDRLMGQSR